MSYDMKYCQTLKEAIVSIPLEQGNVLRPVVEGQFGVQLVSIPLEQGNVVRHRLNFGYYETRVSIPLEQGNVLRQNGELRLISLPFVSIPLEQGNVLRPQI